MAASPHGKFVADGSILGLSPRSSSLDDQDIVELSPSPAAARGWYELKQKGNQIDPHSVTEIGEDPDYNEDDDMDALLTTGESKTNYKAKQPIEIDSYLQKHVKGAFSNDLVSLSKNHGPTHDAPLGGVVDLMYIEKVEYDPYGDEDEYEYENDDDDDDDNNDDDGYDTQLVEHDDEIDLKYRLFKQFDTAKDDSDHYFRDPNILKNCPVTKEPSKDWVKRIQHEWRILEKDLPETIYVRIYEERMDILRAVIVGPDGTPYHDGLFFFDICFPLRYPDVPPMVHYHSGGLRLNPNLYECGKVCLSLLNTWDGNGCEKWNPSNSTMLQVLVSIQALVLNAKPYFNEPGYASTAKTSLGEKRSLTYNEETFVLSCKTMLYSLRRPPRHFEDLVAVHFAKYGHKILLACKAYIGGVQVGCLVGDDIQDVDDGHKHCSPAFTSGLTRLFDDLLMEFTVKGVNCDKFLAE